MIELLVGYVKYLKREESIQGTIDDDALLAEYAAEYLKSIEERERARRQRARRLCKYESAEPGTLLCALDMGHDGDHVTHRYAR